ncbi:MAG: dipicolinate synthase subunit B, partial [Oscillospiraceae bacterium]
STNDALSGSAKNIGTLQNIKNFYFVPYGQDNYDGKPTSLVAYFDKIPQTLEYALNKQQIQPIL